MNLSGFFDWSTKDFKKSSQGGYSVPLTMRVGSILL